LLTAYAETPAPADRMADLAARLLPGSESIRDCAFFFGSSVGTEELNREEESWTETARTAGDGRAGLRRAAPAGS
jgi:hypothetical protein